MGCERRRAKPAPQTLCTATKSWSTALKYLHAVLAPQTRVLASLEGHTKRCTGVSWVAADVIVSSSADKTARVWRAGGEGGSEWSCASVLRDHTAEVVGVTTHPSRRYFVTGSTDASWAFYDVASLTCLRQVGTE